MSPRRVIFSTLVASLCFGAAAPALADYETEGKRWCVALSGDPEKQEYAPICVVLPDPK